MALPASADATLATTPVPYMGWNTYYQVGGNFRVDDQVGGAVTGFDRPGESGLQHRVA